MKEKLEDLLRQKKEIEKKIRALKIQQECETELMLFKVNKEEKEYKYQVSAKGVYIKRIYAKEKPYSLIEEAKTDRWYPFIREKSPAKVIEQLEKIGKDIPVMIESIKKQLGKLETEAIAEHTGTIKSEGSYFIKRKDTGQYVADFTEHSIVYTKEFIEARKYRTQSAAKADKAEIESYISFNGIEDEDIPKSELVVCFAI